MQGLEGIAGGYCRLARSPIDPTGRGHPHVCGGGTDQPAGRDGQAPAYRPQPQRPGGPGSAAVSAGSTPESCKRSAQRARSASLCDQAEEHLETVMPGYTHLQRAQPITFGHHLMAYAEMFAARSRPPERLQQTHECHAAGQRRAGRHHLSHRPACVRRKLLGFDDRLRTTAWTASPTGISASSLPRHLSIIMMHLSRFSRGDHPLVLLGVSSLSSWTTPIATGSSHHAAEEKPRRRRADPRQDRPRLRRPHRPCSP